MRRKRDYLLGIAVIAAGLGLAGFGIVRAAATDLETAGRVASVIDASAGVLGLLITLAGTAITVALHRQPAPARPQESKEEDRPVASGPSAEETIAADIDRLRITLAVVYDRLFGVEEVTKSVGELLSNPAGPRVVSLWGGAGVGKTTLAYEVVGAHARPAGFARVFGVSAKFRQIGPSGEIRSGQQRISVDWREPLVELAQQIDPAVSVDQDRVERILPDLFPDRPCLVTIDNLETVKEAHEIVKYLARTFADRPHRFLITTRKSVAGVADGQVTERPWDGPTPDDAKRLARHLATHSGLKPREADLGEVVRIAERTPLLIQIIVGLAVETTRPIAEVIQRLRDVDVKEGRDLWTYCFADAMQSLADGVGSRQVASQLMAVFCYPGRTVGDHEFFRLSRIADRETFLKARGLACRLTLVRAMDGNTRFTVHPLLREHFCGATRRTE